MDAGSLRARVGCTDAERIWSWGLSQLSIIGRQAIDLVVLDIVLLGADNHNKILDEASAMDTGSR